MNIARVVASIPSRSALRGSVSRTAGSSAAAKLSGGGLPSLIEPLGRYSTRRLQKPQCPICPRFMSTNLTPRSPKAWLDKTRSLPSRVQALMDAPQIHPTEIENVGSNLQNLLVDCCKLRNIQGMQLANEIMERLLVEKGRYRDQRVDVFIPVKLWETVLFGWTKLAKKEVVALERMKDLISTVITEAKADFKYLQTKDLLPNDGKALPSQPTVEIFNTYLKGLAEASRLSPAVALTAEATIFEMKDYHSQLNWHTKPNTRSYTFAITAHANSWHPKSGERAVAILRYVQNEHDMEKAAFLEKRGFEYEEDKINSTTPKIVTADATMYTVAMNAVLQSRSPPKMVLTLLDAARDAGVLDRVHYNLAIKGIGRKVELTKNPRQRLQLAGIAEKLHAKAMECPDVPKVSKQSTMNACLDVWSRTYVSEMGSRSEALLNEMMRQGMMPDSVSFHCIIRAWSKSTKFHGDKALSRMEAMLDLQESLAEQSEGGVEFPGYMTYAIAILGYVGVGENSVEQACQLLDRMLAAYRERRLTRGTDKPCAPFGAVLTVTAKAPKVEDAADKAWSDDSNTDPYDVANRIYDHVTENTYQIDGLVPDHHFYAAFLRNLVAHGNPQSVDFETTALRVWEQACEAGEVSRLVLSQAMQISVLEQKLSTDSVEKTRDLPQFWRRQVEPRWL